MKKTIRLLVCAVLSAVLLAGCVPAVPSKAAPPASAAYSQAVASAGIPASTPTPVPANQGTLRVLLPAARKNVSNLLQQVAQLEGITLSIEVGTTAEAYAAQAVRALAEESPPDLLMLDSAAEATAIGTWILEDMAGADMPPPFAALSNMVPTASRLLEKNKVYGLPLGYAAEGYLVDIEMLAALLGATNTAVLTADLTKASWEQWSQMLAALELYLQKPVGMRIKLGDNTYTTPGYRPKIAQPLRGIFAFADGAPGALMQSALGAALYAPFENPEDWRSTAQDELRDSLFPSLESLYALMDFETLHMARPEGAVFRGEEYLVRPPLAEAEAALLFAEGTALLLRAGSRTGLALEQQHPRLQGRLALLPVKLPPPVLPEEEDESASASSSSSASAPANEDDDETAEAEKTAAERAAAGIEAQNTRLWYRADGYLCINAQSPNQALAQAFFMKLYTTGEGTTAIINELQLHPFSDLLPASTLSQQVSRVAMAGQGALLPAPDPVLDTAGQAIGAFVADNLMGKAEWGEEEAYDFLTTSLQALGYRLTPELGL